MKKVKKKKVKKTKVARRQSRKLEEKQGIKRTTGGQYGKGVCGNPKGRPTGSKNKYSVADLQVAIEKVEGKKKKTFLEAWISAAWGNATDMANVANFMLPKLRAIEQVNIAADSTSDEEAERWRKEMYERFHPA